MRTLWTLIALAVFSASATAQEGDKWLVIDKFSGLNLYLEKTQLQPGQSLLAENVQFRKPGTISVIEGLTYRVSAGSGADPILGIGSITDFVNDSDRIVVACSTVLWNTYGATMGFIVQGTAPSWGNWQTWADSTRMQSTTGEPRAAEYWRPGWIVTTDSAGTDIYDTIDYISDNNTVFFTAGTSANQTESKYTKIRPVINDSVPVRFVNVDVGASPRLLILQAGFEPIFYDNSPTEGYHYFGVADSGTVQSAGSTGGDSDSNGTAWIVDNAQTYPTNTIGGPNGNGYYLHLPYEYSDTDSSHWGRVFRIDSNSVAFKGDTVEYRIYFNPGDSAAEHPGGDWLDSLKGSRYQLISAPLLRDVITSHDAPLALVHNGGRMMWMATGTIDARSTDHVPHVIRFRDRADTLVSTHDSLDIEWNCVCPPNIFAFWRARCSSRHGCYWDVDTTDFSRTSVLGMPETKDARPVRTIYIDTIDSPDLTAIWCSGSILSNNTAPFSTTNWSLQKLTIPYASDGVVYRDRLYLAGDPEAPNIVFYSEPLQPGAFPNMNWVALGFDGDVFTGFALLYDWLVVFQREHTYLLKHDPTGGTIELALPDEGCIAQGSIFEMENHVVYLSTKGWRMFDGNTAQDFALPIKPAVQSQPRVSYSASRAANHKAAAAVDATTGNIWMSQAFGASSTNNGSFLYNFVDGSFSYSSAVYGGKILSTVFADTLHLIFTHPDSGHIYTYGFRDSLDNKGIDGDSIDCKVSSGWLDFGNSKLTKHVDDGVIHFVAQGPGEGAFSREFRITMYKDKDTASFYADTVDVTGLGGNVLYEWDVSARLEPSMELTWLRIEIEGFGLNVMEIERIALRYRDGVTSIFDTAVGHRP